MNLKEIENELKERLHTSRLELDGEAGASSCSAFFYTINDNDKIFVKLSDKQHAFAMLNGEMESLKHISATKTVRVPKPLLVIDNCYGYSVLVMERLNLHSLKADCAKMLGEKLANLHGYNHKVIRFNERANKWVGKVQPSVKAAKELAASRDIDSGREEADEEKDEEQQFTKHGMRLKAGGLTEPAKLDGQYPDRFIPEPDTQAVHQFGFDVPTSCGYLPQVNDWNDDWVSFYARNRLDKSIRSLLSEYGDREFSELWSRLQLKLDKFFVDFAPKGEDEIVPALLHGDLWTGNVDSINDQTEGPIPVIYDPSSFYGHSEYDFGIARMFGSFPKEFEKAYFEIIPKKKNFESRNKLYQLFHHLNHWQHFGTHYRSSSVSLMKQLNNLV